MTYFIMTRITQLQLGILQIFHWQLFATDARFYIAMEQFTSQRPSQYDDRTITNCTDHICGYVLHFIYSVRDSSRSQIAIILHGAIWIIKGAARRQSVSDLFKMQDVTKLHTKIHSCCVYQIVRIENVQYKSKITALFMQPYEG